MSPTQIQTRRRTAGLQAPPRLDPKPCNDSLDSTSLRKGSTFHSPTSPSSAVDPVLDIRSLPRRAPTSPQALEDLVAASDKKIADIISSFDRSFSGLTSDDKLDNEDALPVPGFFVAHATVADADSMDVDATDASQSKQKDTKASKLAAAPACTRDHHHASDSGLGSSICTVVADGPQTRTKVRQTNSRSSTKSASSVYSAINQSHSSKTSRPTGHQLSEYATRQIKKHIIEPILAEQGLKNYHNLIRQLPDRIGNRNITCLRDLEKTLIFLAPSKAKSAASYLNFCETSIQCIHTTVGHLNELDQRRPTDRPYTNNYFVDLVEQVRQYARIMATSRQKQAEGKPLDEMDYTPDEKIHLRGGMSQNGKPAELVREKDGKMIAIDADHVPSGDVEDEDDSDVERSMARKRKCDIGKEEIRSCRECGKGFKRPCDLTKHEKTHSRPWKCPEQGCKYHELGWPTEKERDRHHNDKHSAAPNLYRCAFPPCTYTSKRESNCKQHMEKAHNYDYVRSKTKKSQSLVPVKQTPPSNYMPTPTSSSAFPNLSTPATPFMNSPSDSLNSPAGSMLTNSTNMQGSIHSLMQDDGLLYNHHDPSYNFGEFGQNDMQGYAPFSPQNTDSRRGSVISPVQGNYGVIDSSLPTSAFEQDFNFGDMNVNNPWPSPVEFFAGQYTVQQPTPAWSDNMNFDTGNDFEAHQPVSAPQAQSLIPQLSPGAHGDIMFSEMTHVDEGYSGQQSHDFALFGETAGPAGGESSSMAHGQMFPDLGNVGGQFPSDPMYEGMNEGEELFDFHHTYSTGN